MRIHALKKCFVYQRVRFLTAMVPPKITGCKSRRILSTHDFEPHRKTSPPSSNTTFYLLRKILRFMIADIMQTVTSSAQDAGKIVRSNSARWRAS